MYQLIRKQTLKKINKSIGNTFDQSQTKQKPQIQHSKIPQQYPQLDSTSDIKIQLLIQNPSTKIQKFLKANILSNAVGKGTLNY